MKTIWKFPLPNVTPFVAWLPQGAEILCVQTQGDSPCIWALVDSDAPKEKRSCRHEEGDETMSLSSFRAVAELADRDDDYQPSYTCDHCSLRAKDAVAITLNPWNLSDTRASAGWLCGKCADALRVWLGDEPESDEAEKTATAIGGQPERP